MNQYSLVYLGPFERAPFFGGTFWFDIDVPQAVRGDLAAQLLFTKKADGSQQFQLASETEFNGMLFNGFIAAGTLSDGLVWDGGSRSVAMDAITSTDETNGGDVETNSVVDETIDGTGDTPASPRATGRRARNTGAQT